MNKCSNCGSPVDPGQVFCLECGQEIQWVSDYDSLGNMLEKERMKKAQEEEELKRKKLALAAEQKRKKKKKKKIVTVSVTLVAIAAVGIGLSVKFANDKKKYNDFDYQMRMADTYFSNQKYEESYEFVQRALELDGDDMDAQLLASQLYVKLGEEEKAISTLEKLVSDYPDDATAYGQLIKLYNSCEMPEKIKELLDRCENDTIKTKYAGYISKSPVFSLPAGTFSEEKNLVIYSKENEGTIYYTTDGTEPTLDSTVYTEAIPLSEGTTTVKAFCVNAKGIASDIVENTYQIEFKAPDAPRISPSSGTFTTDMNTQIYIIVPNGCKAYYAFDEIPTIEDEEYDVDRPVEMLYGEHTFYAILVDSHNKVSEVGKATYTLTEPE